MLPNKLGKNLKVIKPVKLGLPSDLFHLHQISFKTKKVYGIIQSLHNNLLIKPLF